MYGMEMFIGKEYFSENDNSVTTKNKYSSIRIYRMMRNMVKDKKFDSVVKEHIVKDKDIKSGVPIIKGTRISTKNILRMIMDGYDIDQIKVEFPSITDDKQILAAIVYEVRKMNYISFLMRTYMKD